MRRLHHFPLSPFSRRARLLLAHKGLEHTLVDVRDDEKNRAALHALCPIKTAPVLEESDGRVIADSGTIAHYLDVAYPEKPLFPRDRDGAFAVLELTTLVDVALNTIVETGNRFHPLSDSAKWPQVKGEMVERIQRALDATSARIEKLDRKTVLASGWGAADIWLYTAIAWLEALPARAPSFPVAAQIIGLGWTMPPALPRFADAHRDRADVRALDGVK